MSYLPPKNILITSDGNVLEFVRSGKSKTEPLHIYKFIESETKLGTEVEFTEKNLLKNLSNFFKEIK